MSGSSHPVMPSLSVSSCERQQQSLVTVTLQRKSLNCKEVNTWHIHVSVLAKRIGLICTGGM